MAAAIIGADAEGKQVPLGSSIMVGDNNNLNALKPVNGHNATTMASALSDSNLSVSYSMENHPKKTDGEEVH